MRALTIRQPFASAVAFGDKRVENRSKPVTYRDPIALHAGLSVEWDAPRMAWEAAGLPPYYRGGPRDAWRASLRLGAIVAVADLAGCHHAHDCMPPVGVVPHSGLTGCSPWAMYGQYHWVLANVRALPEPVPCKGKLGLWRLPEDVERAVSGQLDAGMPIRSAG